MGKSLLIIAGAAAVLAMYSLVGGAGTSTSRSAEVVHQHAERVLAREIALSGHAGTLTAIRDEILASGQYSGGQQYSGVFQSGTYLATSEVSGDTLTVITRATRPTTSYVVRGSYLMGDSSNGESTNVPDFMGFGLLAENDFSITGNSRIFGTPGNNANVHTNGMLSIGGNALVQGFGTHVTGASAGAAGHFHPVDNPEDLATVRNGARINIPVFDPTDYLARATIVTHGDLNLGDTELGSKDTPTIWHVKGDLTANGNITLNGYGVFVVEGNATINGTVITTGGEDNMSNVAVYAAGDVTINGTATLYGQVFTAGDLTMNGNATLYGNATTRTNANLSGNFQIHYRNASPALTDPIWPEQGTGVPAELTRVDYREGG